MATTVSPTSAPSTPTTYIPYSSRQAEHVHQLRQQGENPSEIAAILGLSTATVDQYLGIATSNAVNVPNAALAPGPGVAAAPAISVFG